MTTPTVRIEYDDHVDVIFDKVNQALKEHGLAFEDDEQPHDGFCLLELKKVPTGTT